MSNSIPTPYYTLIETTKGDNPALVVVNSALRSFSEREKFAWHLKITIDCLLLGAKGMPTGDEAEILVKVEEKIESSLTNSDNAIFLARITCRGKRDLLFRVHDPQLANDTLERLAAAPTERPWEYRMEQDFNWQLAEPELRLLERDPRIN